MRSVSKKTGVSKKAARDRRILAKATREDRPVSEGISRAARRAGVKSKLDPMLLTGAAFNGGAGFHPDATIADLIVLMFEAPNHDGVVGERSPETFVESVLLCAADEAELVSCSVQSQGMSNEIERVTLRSNWRARIAIELAKRMRAAQAVQGGAL